MFKKDDFVKLVDSHGNFRFGYVMDSRDKGDLLIIDLADEGASKIAWDDEYAKWYPDSVFDINGTPTWERISKSLTDIEKTIIKCLAQVMSVNQIAEKMEIAPATVRTHIRHLKTKLQLETKQQLIVYCQGVNGRIDG